MTLYWDNCRVIFCLFPGINFSFYIQSAVIAAFYITNEFSRRQMSKRWKIRLYIDRITYDSNEYVEFLRLLSKCDVEIFPISLPFPDTSPRYFTALRYILPIQDKSLDAFRTMDTHYLWTTSDVTAVVDSLQNWERSDKRCCLWKYPSCSTKKPYAAGLFGMNISESSKGEKLEISFDFLIYLLRCEHPRIDYDLSNFSYGDDEFLLQILLQNYFVDCDGKLNESEVYYLTAREWGCIGISKRAESASLDTWLTRYRRIADFILSNNMPHEIVLDQKQIAFLYSCKLK